MILDIECKTCADAGRPTDIRLIQIDGGLDEADTVLDNANNFPAIDQSPGHQSRKRKRRSTEPGVDTTRTSPRKINRGVKEPISQTLIRLAISAALPNSKTLAKAVARSNISIATSLDDKIFASFGAKAPKKLKFTNQRMSPLKDYAFKTYAERREFCLHMLKNKPLPHTWQSGIVRDPVNHQELRNLALSIISPTMTKDQGNWESVLNGFWLDNSTHQFVPGLDKLAKKLYTLPETPEVVIDCMMHGAHCFTDIHDDPELGFNCSYSLGHSADAPLSEELETDLHDLQQTHKGTKNQKTVDYIVNAIGRRWKLWIFWPATDKNQKLAGDSHGKKRSGHSQDNSRLSGIVTDLEGGVLIAQGDFDTIVVPTFLSHAVFTPEPSLMVGGTFKTVMSAIERLQNLELHFSFDEKLNDDYGGVLKKFGTWFEKEIGQKQFDLLTANAKLFESLVEAWEIGEPFFLQRCDDADESDDDEHKNAGKLSFKVVKRTWKKLFARMEEGRPRDAKKLRTRVQILDHR